MVVSLASERLPRFPQSTAIDGPLFKDIWAELAVSTSQNSQTSVHCYQLKIVDGAVRMLKYAQRSRFDGIWPLSHMF